MEALKELQQQNREIAELCRVLRVLLNDTSVCDTAIARELFQRFTGSVKAHLTLESNSLYATLLSHGDSEVNNVTGRFLENSRELQRIFARYERQWCKKGAKVQGNEEFIRETHSIFDMILDRIHKESEQFFPMASEAIAQPA
ncbi:MAG: hemerythrin domain-containing protein [Pseudomonadota bacterium]